ncbi:MAG TPA: hypothetical protein VKV20_18395 [Ktedonobacteraceae bacterium]|nr:hypothetical protein [Ktedonobacteraceae bacterium]
MYEQLTPAMQHHAQILQRYICAMENGDVDTIASVLSEAEQNQALERMILEINAVYQDEDHTLARPADIAMVRQIVLAAAAGAGATENAETGLQLDGRQEIPVYGLSQVALDETPEPAGATAATGQQALKALPARRATVQVLPARKIEPRKWYRVSRGWVIAAVAAVLIVLVLVPNAGALASQFLSLFRVQHFQTVQVTKQDIKTLSSRPIPSFEDLGTLQVQPGSLQTQDDLTEAQAAHMVNFPILLPHYLPRGISGPPDFSVMSAGQATFTFNAGKARAFFSQNGYGNVNIPANLDGATFELTISAGVAISYGNGADTQFMIMEVPSPLIRATGSASLEELRNVALSLPGLPSQLVAQLKQIDLSSGVIPLPVPSGINSQPITVHGSSGLLLTRNVSTTLKQFKQFPAGSAVVWQTGNIIYAVGGTVSDTNQLLTSANSLY